MINQRSDLTSPPDLAHGHRTGPHKVADPTAFQRANYICILESYRNPQVTR